MPLPFILGGSPTPLAGRRPSMKQFGKSLTDTDWTSYSAELVWELRPAVRSNKGDAVRRIIIPPGRGPTSPLSLGLTRGAPRAAPPPPPPTAPGRLLSTTLGGGLCRTKVSTTEAHVPYSFRGHHGNLGRADEQGLQEHTMNVDLGR